MVIKRGRLTLSDLDCLHVSLNTEISWLRLNIKTGKVHSLQLSLNGVHLWMNFPLYKLQYTYSKKTQDKIKIRLFLCIALSLHYLCT